MTLSDALGIFGSLLIVIAYFGTCGTHSRPKVLPIRCST